MIESSEKPVNFFQVKSCDFGDFEKIREGDSPGGLLGQSPCSVEGEAPSLSVGPSTSKPVVKRRRSPPISWFRRSRLSKCSKYGYKGGEKIFASKLVNLSI